MGNDIQHPKKAAMLLALHKTIGVVTPACEEVSINPATHYKWLKSDEAYAEAVKAIKNVAKDFAESKLHKAMKNGNITAIIFYLKTQAKDRGYIEKAEFDHNFQGAGGGIMFYIPENGRDKKPEDDNKNDESEKKTEPEA